MKRRNFSWRDFDDLSQKRKDKEIVRAYREISMLTGVKLEESVDHSYGLVIKPGHDLFGKIGVYDWVSTSRVGDHHKKYFKFKGKRDSVEFSTEKDDEILHAKNIIMILQREEKLQLLFPDAFD